MLPDTDELTQLQGLLRELRRMPISFSPDGEQTLEGIFSDARRLAVMSSEQRHALWLRVVFLCLKEGAHALLSAHNVPHPAYNFLKEMEENEGPWDTTPDTLFTGPAEWRLLGRRVQFPFGVPSCVMTRNRFWVRHWARWGYNILTFKTVRSRADEGLPEPRWRFLSDQDAPWLSPESPAALVVAANQPWPKNIHAFSAANSFGVKSDVPAVWQEEYRRSLEELAEGQLLLLSVMGEAHDELALIQDFVEAARYAAQTNPHAIELNLSCPNNLVSERVGAMRPAYCESRDLTESIVRAVADEVPDVPLVVKLSYMRPQSLTPLVERLTPYVAAFSGINTQPAAVLDENGEPFFRGTRENPDVPRSSAGISGRALTVLAQDFTRTLAECREELGASFDIIAMGGVMTPDDAVQLFRLGADAVQSATAPSVNSRLAAETLVRVEEILHQEAAALLSEDPDADPYSASAETFAPPSVMRRVLEEVRRADGAQPGLHQMVRRTA